MERPSTSQTAGPNEFGSICAGMRKGEWYDARDDSAARRGDFSRVMEPQRAASESQIARIRTWTLLTFAVIIIGYCPIHTLHRQRLPRHAAAAPPEARRRVVRGGPRSLRLPSAARLVAAEKADRALRARAFRARITSSSSSA